MTADPKKKPTARFWITVALLVVLVAYPLSMGPISWIFFHVLPKSSLPLINALYAPIEWAAGCSPIAGSAAEWYVSLWVDPDKLVEKASEP
jgi:hypothetical protein